MSYTAADRAWAEWIAWQLEQAGYAVFVQAWDILPGQDFVHEMHRVSQQARCTMPVLSPAYLTSSAFGEAEWRVAFAADPAGQDRRLVPVRVADCRPQGLLGTRTYIDLVEMNQEEARRALLAGMKDSGRPESEPAFPASRASWGTASPRFPGALPPVFNVPARSLSPLAGRDEELAELEGRLAAAGPAGPVAVTGVGGVGKTRLVLEYVYGQVARFDVVWWVRGEEPITLLGDFAALAEAPGLPDSPAGLERGDTDAAVAAARGWLECHDRWLLLIDNVEDPSLLRGLLPRGGGGRVLLTSRADVGWAGMAATLSLQSLGEQAAARLLTDRSGDPDVASAQQLARRLGGLPLALEQAAAYVAESGGMSLAGYLQLFETRSVELFERGRPADRTDTIATTWSLTLDRLASSEPVAVALLQLTSFMDSEGFPVTLLQPYAGLLDDSLAVVVDPIVLADALLALRRHGLVVVDADMVTVHRVLQTVVRDGLAKDEQRSLAGSAVGVLAAAFPAGVLDDAASWATARMLLPHVLAATSHTESLKIAAPASCWLLDRAGTFLHAAGQYRDAVPLFERALDIGVGAVGPDHPLILRIHNNYGLLLWKLGRLPAARDHLEQALDPSSTPPQLDQMTFATTAGNLGMVLLDLGKPTEAREQFERSLRVMRRACGSGSPETLKASSNLASALKELGELRAAKRLLMQAIRHGVAPLGPDHPLIATTRNNLGSVLSQLGEAAAAREQYEHALSSGEAVLGAEHPDVSTWRHNLGLALLESGDVMAAKAQIERALACDIATFGADHPSVAIARNSLGKVLESLGQLAEAYTQYSQAIDIATRTLGEGHPSLATYRGNLEEVARQLLQFGESND